MNSPQVLKSFWLAICLMALFNVNPSNLLQGQQVDDPKPSSLPKDQQDAQADRESSEAAQPDSKRDDRSGGQPAQGLTYANPVRTKWKVTTKIRGSSRPAQNMFISIPVPNDWPEQSVAPAEEDIPPEIGNVKYRDLNSNVRQLLVLIPKVKASEEITISMTFLVATCQITAPPDPSVFLRPKTSHREGKEYLGISPLMNFRDSKLRKMVKEVTADKENLWSEVEAIFDWVRDNVEDDNEEPRELVDVFRNQTGCNEDKVRLFVGMCRAHKIPARMVWVEGTQYAEFMLVDSEANAHWFPCTVGGIREFGSISEPRIVLQKGDSIRVPEKEGRQKFVAEFATCQGTAKPAVKFYRQLLPAD